MLDRYLEHPEITRALMTGYATQVRFPHCPICGSEADTVYRDRNGEVFACDVCVDIRDAWEIGK